MVCISISGVLHFSELTQSEVEKVLDFIYDGSVSFDSEEHYERFVANAKKLGLHRLPKLVEPLHSADAAGILAALLDRGVDHAAIFLPSLEKLYVS